MQRLSERKRVVQRWRELEKKVADMAELIDLSADDVALQAEIQSELDEMAAHA